MKLKTQSQGLHKKNSYQMLFVAVVSIHSLPDVECSSIPLKQSRWQDWTRKRNYKNIRLHRSLHHETSWM